MQKLAEAASGVLNCLISSLVTFYLVRDAAAMPCIPWTAEQAVPVEAWIFIDGRHTPEGIIEGMKPDWHVPNAEEVIIKFLMTSLAGFTMRAWLVHMLKFVHPRGVCSIQACARILLCLDICECSVSVSRAFNAHLKRDMDNS